MQDIGVLNARAAEGVPERSVELGCPVCVGWVIPRALWREHCGSASPATTVSTLTMPLSSQTLLFRGFWAFIVNSMTK